MDKKLLDILKEFWGYQDFREPQKPIVKAVFEGSDTFAMLPTGGGKSICFQVPAIAKPGVALVMSPLISLMEDQVHTLKNKGVRAECIHSGISKIDQERIMSNAAMDKVKLLYISPEKLDSPLFQQSLKHIPLSMIVVDEAHCISQWGHDFRPAYRKILTIREYFENLQIVAFTATATKQVQKDIVYNLDLRNPKIFLSSLIRWNLKYYAFKTEDRIGYIIKYCKSKQDQSGIVYVRNRKATVKLARLLKEQGLKALPYHAGLDSKLKSKTQEDWIKNNLQIVVATNAFGMGIDKPDVRFVLHYEAPPSLEEYIQEAGRAGRDGEISDAVLLYGDGDLISKQEKIDKEFPDRTILKGVYSKLCEFYKIAPGHGPNSAFLFDLATFSREKEIPIVTAHHSLQILKKAGYIHISDSYYKPSTIWIYPDKFREFLNNQDNKYRELLSLLLRKYDGIYFDFTRIREKDLSSKLDKSTKEIKEAIEYLQLNGVLEYREENNNAFINFLLKRPTGDKLVLPKSVYEDRKQVMYDQLLGVINYASSQDCRQLYIDNHFGFESTKACKVCDNCDNIYDVDETYIEYEIKESIARGNIAISSLLSNRSIREQDAIKKMLKVWEGEKVIVIKKNYVSLLK